jgi:hypothetical protein
VNAFTQAPADCDIFMNIPPGFIVEINTLVFTHSSTKDDSKDYFFTSRRICMDWATIGSIPYMLHY